MARLLILGESVELNEAKALLHSAHEVQVCQHPPPSIEGVDLCLLSLASAESWRAFLADQPANVRAAKPPSLVLIPRPVLDGLDTLEPGLADDVLGWPSSRLELAIRIDHLLVRNRENNRRTETQSPELKEVLGATAARLVDTRFLGLVVFDTAGRIQEANDAFLRMLGQTRAEVSAGTLHWPSSVPTEHQALHASMLAEVTARGACEPREVEFLRHDNSRVSLLIAYVSAGGLAPLTVGYAVDVTARTRATEELRVSNERLELIARATRDSLWDWDLRTNKAWWNDNYYESFGIDRNTTPSLEAWLAIVHPDDRERVQRDFNQALASRARFWSYEYRHVSVDGAYTHVLDRGYTQLDANGNPIRIVGAVMDVTEQKQYESERRFLAEASARLSQSLVWDQTVEAIAELGLPFLSDWCIVELESDDGGRTGVLTQLGAPDASIMMSRYVPDGAASVDEPRLVTENARDVVRQFFPSLKDEQRQALGGTRSFIVAPLLAGGRVRGMVAWGNRSERRRHGKRELTLITDLVHRCATAVENALLYQRARVAIRARDEFLSIAAHEMKTPLATLKAYATLLQIPAARDEARLSSSLEAIDRQCSRLTRLVERMVEFTLLQVGDYRLHRAPIDLAQLAAQTIRRMGSGTTKHGIVLDAETSLVVDADPERIAEVLANLVENAIKFSKPDEAIRITVGRSGKDALLSVQDFGIGIPAGQQRDLFERFHRADIDRDSRMEGMGLGLWICHELISRHGGHIWCDSVEGEGTTFSFTLPLAPGVRNVA